MNPFTHPREIFLIINADCSCDKVNDEVHFNLTWLQGQCGTCGNGVLFHSLHSTVHILRLSSHAQLIKEIKQLTTLDTGIPMIRL